MKNIVLNILILAVGILLFQCQKASDWSDEVDNIAPGMVTNTQVTNTAGGAIITFTIPNDDDLLAIKALYSYTTDGEVLEAYCSSYTDTIKLEGFPDTDTRTVQLIAIDKSKNESEPVSVEIQPLTPPVDLVVKTLKVSVTFGGLYVSWENETGADVGIILYVKDSLGNYTSDYTYYSDNSSGEYSFRGFDSEETDFRLQVRDRWENYSEELDTTLTPLYETQLYGEINGTDIWSRYGYADGSITWRGDEPDQQDASSVFENVWDQDYTSESGYWHSGRPGNYLSQYTDEIDDAEVLPIYFTIDLGKSCQLSRHKLWHRAKYCMKDKQVKSYQIWATNETPKGVDDFNSKLESLAYWTSWEEVGGTDAWKNDGWDMICDCDGIPPSGATTAADVTSEDQEIVGEEGLEYDIYTEYTGTPYRYVRFVCTEGNWSGSTIIHIGELEFWGAYADE